MQYAKKSIFSRKRAFRRGEKWLFGEKSVFSGKKTNYDEYKREKFKMSDVRLMCCFLFYQTARASYVVFWRQNILSSLNIYQISVVFRFAFPILYLYSSNVLWLLVKNTWQTYRCVINLKHTEMKKIAFSAKFGHGDPARRISLSSPHGLFRRGKCRFRPLICPRICLRTDPSDGIIR